VIVICSDVIVICSDVIVICLSSILILTPNGLLFGCAITAFSDRYLRRFPVSTIGRRVFLYRATDVSKEPPTFTRLGQQIPPKHITQDQHPGIRHYIRNTKSLSINFRIHVLTPQIHYSVYNFRCGSLPAFRLYAHVTVSASG
jgi:hypothetical protein